MLVNSELLATALRRSIFVSLPLESVLNIDYKLDMRNRNAIFRK